MIFKECSIDGTPLVHLVPPLCMCLQVWRQSNVTRLNVLSFYPFPLTLPQTKYCCVILKVAHIFFQRSLAYFAEVSDSLH